MKVVIQDASVLIDLADCGLLDVWFGCGFDLRTTSLVLREVIRNNQKLHLQHYLDSGQLGVETASGEILAEIALLMTTLSARLSIQDTSAIFFADKLQSILLTGDRKLREYAVGRGVETHGLLWVFDTLVARGVLAPTVAADRLEWLRDQGTSRLPHHECEVRIKRWRRTASN